MVRQLSFVFFFVCLTFLDINEATASDEFSLGIGARYWQTVENLSESDDRGGALVFSIQGKKYDILKMQFEAEVAGNEFSGLEADDGLVVVPQLYMLVGGRVYAGVGLGISLSCTNNVGDASEPFAGARIGLELPTPWSRVALDLNGTYLFNAFDEFDEEETDAFTVGIVARFGVK